jgi:hypothetical protein
MNALELLRRFLVLAIDGEEEGTEGEAAAPPPEEAGTGDAALDDLIDAVETPGKAAPAGDDNPIVKEARERADRLERELEQERAARRAQPAVAPVPTVDTEYEREEQQLAAARRDGADEGTLRWLQWQIDSNRKIRATERNSQQALSRAEDLADRTAFEKLEITKPGVYKKYAERVEKEVTEGRFKGSPRLGVLRLLIGDDILSGKIKPKTKSAPAAGAPAATVDRGRTPGVRTDVRPGKGNSEREKRRARLENQLI